MKLEHIKTARAGEYARAVRHGDYAYNQTEVAGKPDNPAAVSFMEILPGKAAFPYHFHTGSAEVFHIISGSGILETPDGEKTVGSGDVIVFPKGANGAHKLRNASETEPLRYLDVDTTSETDVIFYPQSGKIGVQLNGGDGVFFRKRDNVDYYDGE